MEETMVNNADTTRENLGPAERIIQTVLSYSDHMVHNRPGMVVADKTSVTGVRWFPVTHKEEEGQKVVYRLDKVGKKTNRVRQGVLRDNGDIYEGRNKVGQYRPAGIFPEVATWMYKQVAEVWKLDNEFAARWASYVYNQDNRDMKVVMAAFMLVQSRRGAPVTEDGQVLFYDEDFRDVGEAMMLLRRKDNKDLNPKMLLRVHDVLSLPQVAAVNKELGFGHSGRKPFLGRWTKATEKWLRYREENVPLLNGLVKAGYRRTVMELARRCGFKPETPQFFELLRWKQVQSKDGRRTIAIGQEVTKAEDWSKLTEEEICQTILRDRPSYKRVIRLVPPKVGLTRAIVAASVEAGCFSDKDLITHTPTLEELGLLQVQEVKDRWERAIKAAEDMRAANIALRVRNKEAKEKLQEASDNALKKAAEEVTRNMRIYFMIDCSGSMQGAIETAKEYLTKFVQAFPLDRIHVCHFNTAGREVAIRHASAAGVQNALKGIGAGGGTDYGAGVRALAHHKPQEDEDVLFVFVGDEGASKFTAAVNQSGLRPMAFGFIKVVSPGWGEHRYAVQETAASLGIPCMMLDNNTFNDVYAIPRTIRAMMAATPVGTTSAGVQRKRVSLVDEILKTELLKKPIWATATVQ
jgi:hypothetical protein